LLAGATVNAVDQVSAPAVSILTRHCWRVLPFSATLLVQGLLVSILTRHCWRVLRFRLCHTNNPMLFQSSPAIAGGCYADGSNQAAAPQMFQSSPAIAGGCYAEMGASVLDKLVSILTRHCWRVLLV